MTILIRKEDLIIERDMELIEKYSSGYYSLNFLWVDNRRFKYIILKM